MKTVRRTDLTWRQRLSLAFVGAFTILYGYGQVLRGQRIYPNWLEQEVPVQFTFVIGAVFLLFAAMPWSCFHFLWEPGGKKRRQ